MAKKLLQDMTWKQVEAKLKEMGDAKVAIIPTGSTEQHGPHMPLGTDFMIAETLAGMINEKSNVLVTPVIPVGFAEYHTDFAGSLSVSTDVFVAYVSSIVKCLLRYGITHVLFVNGHGGNAVGLGMVCRELRNMGITAAYSQWWHLSGSINPKWALQGHGDYIETSMVMSIHPEGLDMASVEPIVNEPLTDKLENLDGTNVKFKDGSVCFGLRLKDVTKNGTMMEYGHDPNADFTIPITAASKELGDDLMEGVSDYLVEFIEEFKKVKFEKA